MKKLIIIGGGSMAREVYAWAKQMPEHGKAWTIKGFLDSRADILNGYTYDVGILSSVEDYQPEEEDLFTCALGDPKSKQKYVEMVLQKGGKFTSIIHPTTVIGENVKIGQGVLICPYVILCSDCQIGNFVSINGRSGIGHDAQIGDWTVIQSVCDITGFVKIGASVTINSHGVILPRVQVGEGATIGAGSVAVANVKPGATVFGVPALPLKF